MKNKHSTPTSLIGSTTWKTYSGCWHQKSYTNDRGDLTYTYYYQSKSSSPALSIVINTRLTRMYCGYTLIDKDLEDILGFIEIVKGLINIPGKNADLTVKGLSRAIAITYGKCFTKADGRKTKLEADIISADVKDIHEQLIHMRNNYVAHAGISTHEECIGSLAIPPESKVKKYDRNIPKCFFTEAYQTIASELIVSKETRQLIEHAQAIVKKKLLKTGLKLHERYDNLNFSKIYKIAKNMKPNRIQLNEEDIERLTCNLTG